MSRVDLHIHTTASDGRFSPSQIVCQAAELGMAVIAITDHDSVDGIAAALEAVTAFPRLKLIPGVEISTNATAGEVHVLGYFIDHTNRELGTSLKRLRHSRQDRARKIVTKLDGLGISVDYQRVAQIAGTGAMGRPHIAQAMLEAGYISSFKDAFDRYLGRDRPAYVSREKTSPVEAVQMVVAAGGLPVLAHPFTASDPEGLIAQLKTAGLIGIEAHYNGYSATEIACLVNLAQKYHLITTGGSDYHGIETNNETPMGGAKVPMAAAEQLIALADS